MKNINDEPTDEGETDDEEIRAKMREPQFFGAAKSLLGREGLTQHHLRPN